MFLFPFPENGISISYMEISGVLAGPYLSVQRNCLSFSQHSSEAGYSCECPRWAAMNVEKGRELSENGGSGKCNPLLNNERWV